MHAVINSPSTTFCRRPVLDSSSATCHLIPFRSMRCRDVRQLTKLVTPRSRHPRLAVGVHSGRHSIAIVASSEAAECISRGLEKYANGDRMGALKFFEESLQKDPTTSQRQAALFNSTAVHASFGDIELAQITLREGVNRGLDFEGALKSTDNPQLVRFQGSPQIVIQLRKFAEAVRRIKGAVSPADKPAAVPSGRSAASAGGGGGGYLGRDMSSMLRTDMTGIDPSLAGIFKRVAGLLVTGLVLGTILFYVGLQLTFPSYN